jgi:hypothetical protein
MKFILKIFLVASILLNFSISAESIPWKAFESNGLYGFKNQKGKIMLKPEYQMAFDFSNHSVAFVYKLTKWICIDLKNTELLEVVPYDNGPDYFSEKLARYIENRKTGYFDQKCKKVIPANYDFGTPFENGFASVCNGCDSKKDGEHSSIVGGKYGMIDSKGKEVIPIEFDAIQSINIKKKIATVLKGSQSQRIPFSK